MFSTYSVMILAGIITLSFSSIKQYSAGDEESFRGNVLLPLLNSSLWWYILASATWVFEMLSKLCKYKSWTFFNILKHIKSKSLISTQIHDWAQIMIYIYSYEQFLK